MNFHTATLLILCLPLTACFTSSRPGLVNQECRSSRTVRMASEEDGWIKGTVKKTIRSVANLSVKDAELRSKITSETNINEEDIEQIAGTSGKNAYIALQEVAKAETDRAKEIAETGILVRPKDTKGGSKLGDFERASVNALENLFSAESRRLKVFLNEGTLLRPKDSAHPEYLGLLGDLESTTIKELEKLGSGDISPVLKEIDAKSRALIRAEYERLKTMVETGDLMVRPMDGADSILSDAERVIVGLSEYEAARMKELRDNGYYIRPMEKDPDSVAGVTERFGVGLLRGPVMVFNVVKRTKELLKEAVVEEREKLNR